MNDVVRPKILVTGATGKVGQSFLNRFLAAERFADWTVRAICHNRVIPETERLDVVRGSIADRDIVQDAMQDVTHVLHLATCKETPEAVMDVTVKGLFWVLEECRTSDCFKQLILLGGDAGIGHFFYPRSTPVTEEQPHQAYPGCYALSKVLEEVLVEQFHAQYGLNVCCLRAPWIMEKDDFKYQLSFGEDVFGGPRWRDLVGTAAADAYIEKNTIPVMLDEEGEPVLRNFVHVEDLVEAILRALNQPRTTGQTINVCMDEPVNYRELAEYLRETRGFPSVEIRTPFHATWLDNTKAKLLLGWRPRYDLKKMTDAAFDFVRAKDDRRKIWYPG